MLAAVVDIRTSVSHGSNPVDAISAVLIETERYRQQQQSTLHRKPIALTVIPPPPPPPPGGEVSYYRNNPYAAISRVLLNSDEMFCQMVMCTFKSMQQLRFTVWQSQPQSHSSFVNQDRTFENRHVDRNSVSSVRLQFAMKERFPTTYQRLVSEECHGKWHEFLSTRIPKLRTFLYTPKDFVDHPDLLWCTCAHEMRVVDTTSTDVVLESDVKAAQWIRSTLLVNVLPRFIADMMYVVSEETNWVRYQRCRVEIWPGGGRGHATNACGDNDDDSESSRHQKSVSQSASSFSCLDMPSWRSSTGGDSAPPIAVKNDQSYPPAPAPSIKPRAALMPLNYVFPDVEWLLCEPRPSGNTISGAEAMMTRCTTAIIELVYQGVMARSIFHERQWATVFFKADVLRHTVELIDKRMDKDIPDVSRMLSKIQIRRYIKQVVSQMFEESNTFGVALAPCSAQPPKALKAPSKTHNSFHAAAPGSSAASAPGSTTKSGRLPREDSERYVGAFPSPSASRSSVTGGGQSKLMHALGKSLLDRNDVSSLGLSVLSSSVIPSTFMLECTRYANERSSNSRMMLISCDYPNQPQRPPRMVPSAAADVIAATPPLLAFG